MLKNNKPEPAAAVDETSAGAASKRSLLKAAAFGLASGVVAPLLSGSSAAAERPAGRVLIAYYSRTGTTREFAKQIQQQTGGDVFELRTEHSYPAEYRATTNQAKREQQTNFRPQLTAEVQNMSVYDTVFVGFPNWWGTMPMVFFSFLERYDLSGKRIVPFCTHEGSGLGSSIGDIHALSPKATILEGLALRGGGVDKVQSNSARADVAQWLKKVGMKA